MQFVTLQEADWRKRQIELLEKRVERYKKISSVFLYDFQKTHTEGELNSVEKNFVATVYLVHKTVSKAQTQCRLAINANDREAAQNAHHFIKFLTDWLSGPKTDLKAEDLAIRGMVTNPKLIYF